MFDSAERQGGGSNPDNSLSLDELRQNIESRKSPEHERSVLDILAEQADDFGPEDLSMNVDHYLYGLPKKTGR